jgi:hypothetical protein
MAALSEPETLTDFWSSAAQAKTTATKYDNAHDSVSQSIYQSVSWSMKCISQLQSTSTHHSTDFCYSPGQARLIQLVN